MIFFLPFLLFVHRDWLTRTAVAFPAGTPAIGRKPEVFPNRQSRKCRKRLFFCSVYFSGFRGKHRPFCRWGQIIDIHVESDRHSAVRVGSNLKSRVNQRENRAAVRHTEHVFQFSKSWVKRISTLAYPFRTSISLSPNFLPKGSFSICLNIALLTFSSIIVSESRLKNW